MNNILLNSTGNSQAAYDPFMCISEYGPITSIFPQYLKIVQSPSVTQSGSLWLQTLMHMEIEYPSTILQERVTKEEAHLSATQSKKNSELIQLLQSWREGDEQEQRDTWNYLKQALDEDRLSERKQFL